MSNPCLENQRILITGGTGSLSQVLIRRILSEELGKPRQVVIFSRDEAKQHALRLRYMRQPNVSEGTVFDNYLERLSFRIGDVRDYNSVAQALREVDIVFNAAALKQVPVCEYFPEQAVLTNIHGPENIVRAIREQGLPVKTVIGISTDKACKPINVMGMTKALQERIFIQANLDWPPTRFICVRYGNVLASRGSVIPLFHQQIRTGGPLTLTVPHMTRFLLSLNRAVDTVFTALQEAQRGETYIPQVPAARVEDLANILIGDRPIKKVITGIRPGEKLHEILVSEEEIFRTTQRGDYYVIQAPIPELRSDRNPTPVLSREYSSADHVMHPDQLRGLLHQEKLMVEDQTQPEEELLR